MVHNIPLWNSVSDKLPEKTIVDIFYHQQTLHK